MWFDLFRDKSSVSTDGVSISVNYTHWFNRRRSFTIKVSDIIAIDARWIEPFTMVLFLHGKDGFRRTIMDEMEGWDRVLEFIKTHFNGFDCNAYAEAENHLEQTFRCWGKLPGDE